MQCVLARSFWNLPAGHSSQEWLPLFDVNVPLLHAVSSPSLQEWPGLHGRQAVPLNRLPRSHGDVAGLRLPTAQYPHSQISQVDWPVLSWCSPSGHMMCVVEPSGHIEPRGHSAQPLSDPTPRALL